VGKFNISSVPAPCPEGTWRNGGKAAVGEGEWLPCH
jgi:hypothetical protein